LAANPNADINAAIKEFNADPRAVNEYITGLTSGFTDPTATGSGSGTIDYYNKLVEKGIDAQELFGANQALNTDYTFDGNAGEEGIAALQKAFDVAETVKQFDPAGATQLEKDVEWVKLMDQEGFDAKDIARATGVSFNEVAEREAAARAALANVTTPVVEEPVVEQPVVEEPVVEEPVVEAPRLSATQNTTTTVEKPTDISTAPADAVPVGASGAGITTINPNKSVTTTPNVPGRPAGGFTGIEQLRKAYSDAGGSLGYVNPAPRTMQEFNQRFNTMTGDSKSAYDYLTGQGAYPTKSGVGQIMRPYSEATLGIPAAEGNPTQKFIYDPATRSYRENPNYTPVTYSSTGERTTGLSQNAVRSGFNALPPTSDDAAIYAWMQANNITPEQLSAAINAPLDEVRSRIKAVKDQEKKAAEEAAATPFIQGDANGGLMRMAAGGYAVGGGLGALAGGGAASQYNLGGYSDGGRLLRGPGDGVSDSIPATIGGKQPARLADGEFVVPARIVSELGNGSTEAGARKLYAMMDRVQKARGKTTGKNRVAANTRSDKYLPA
jgi:DNA-directed RNA polymerase specialized sigma24 family protein